MSRPASMKITVVGDKMKFETDTGICFSASRKDILRMAEHGQITVAVSRPVPAHVPVKRVTE